MVTIDAYFEAVQDDFSKEYGLYTGRETEVEVYGLRGSEQLFAKVDGEFVALLIPRLGNTARSYLVAIRLLPQQEQSQTNLIVDALINIGCSLAASTKAENVRFIGQNDAAKLALGRAERAHGLALNRSKEEIFWTSRIPRPPRPDALETIRGPAYGEYAGPASYRKPQ